MLDHHRHCLGPLGKIGRRSGVWSPLRIHKCFLRLDFFDEDHSLSRYILGNLCFSLSTNMFRQTALFALALLPFSFAQISDNFESGWNQTKWPIYAPDCNQGGSVALDSSTAHSGKNSIKVSGAGGYCGHIFFGTTQVPTGDVYVRAYV